MMSREKGKFPYSFFILLNQRYEFPAPILTNFYIFIIPLLLDVILFLTSSYLTSHIRINYETSCIGKFSENTQRCIQDHHRGSKMELFVALVSSFQPLTNFTKNPNIDAKGVPNALLEYYNVF